jgi:hypothetical protein
MVNLNSTEFILGEKAGVHIPVSSIVSFDDDAEVIFAAMIPSPSYARKCLINTLVLACKARNNWTKIDAAWVTAANSQLNANLNWKNPATFTLTPVNSPDFTIDEGYTGDEATSYLDPGWNALTNGVNYTLDNASYGAYSLTDIDSNAIMGSIDGATINYMFPRQSAIFYANINTATEGSVAHSMSTGLNVSYRVNDTNIRGSQDGVDLFDIPGASTALSQYNFFILALNNGGAAANYSAFPVAFAFVGSGDIDFNALKEDVVEYLTGIAAL